MSDNEPGHPEDAQNDVARRIIHNFNRRNDRNRLAFFLSNSSGSPLRRNRVRDRRSLRFHRMNSARSLNDPSDFTSTSDDDNTQNDPPEEREGEQASQLSQPNQPVQIPGTPGTPGVELLRIALENRAHAYDGEGDDDEMIQDLTLIILLDNHLGLHFSYPLRRSETRRRGLGLHRSNAIKFPPSDRHEVENLEKLVKLAQDALPSVKKYFISNPIQDPLITFFKRHHHPHRSGFSSSSRSIKRMDIILKKSEKNQLFAEKKRKLSHPSSKKRHKLNTSKYSETVIPEEPKESTSFKQKTLNVPYNSFLSEGSTFDHKFENGTELNFIVKSIDYKTGKLKMDVTVIPNDDDDYISYLTNFNQWIDCGLSCSYSRRARELQKILFEIYSKLPRDCLGDNKKINRFKLFRFEMAGDLVNFKDNDLRITQENIERNFKAQMKSWLQVKPFINVVSDATIKELLRTEKEGIFETLKDSFRRYYMTYSYLKYYNLIENKKVNKFLKRAQEYANRPGKVFKLDLVNAQESIKTESIHNLQSLVTCKDCLLTLQSNHILFKLNLELSDYFELQYNYLVELTKHLQLKNMFDFEKHRGLFSDKDNEALVFVGSLDRRSAEMNLCNLRFIINNETNCCHTCPTLSDDESTSYDYLPYGMVYDGFNDDQEDNDYVHDDQEDDDDEVADDDDVDEAEEDEDEDDDEDEDYSAYRHHLMPNFEVNPFTIAPQYRIHNLNPYSTGGGNQIFSIL